MSVGKQMRMSINRDWTLTVDEENILFYFLKRYCRLEAVSTPYTTSFLVGLEGNTVGSILEATVPAPTVDAQTYSDCRLT